MPWPHVNKTDFIYVSYPPSHVLSAFFGMYFLIVDIFAFYELIWRASRGRRCAVLVVGLFVVGCWS